MCRRRRYVINIFHRKWNLKTIFIGSMPPGRGVLSLSHIAVISWGEQGEVIFVLRR